MSPLAYEHNLARITRLDPDRVELAFDLDGERWPWLSLPPQHPVLLEKFQYFGSLTAVWALGVFEPSVYTALTAFEWTCPEVAPGCGHAVRGVCEKWESDDKKGFTLALHAGDGQTLVTSRGEGVAFATRDFKGWRTHERTKALARHDRDHGDAPALALATAAEVGLSRDGISFVTPLRDTEAGPEAQALVTQAGGFHPHHPFHTGSGDHVNAGHLFDCALQVAHLALSARRPLHCVGGRAAFFRFVELDIPFAIRVAARDPSDGEQERELVFSVSQLGQRNATVAFRLRP